MSFSLGHLFVRLLWSSHRLVWTKILFTGVSEAGTSLNWNESTVEPEILWRLEETVLLMTSCSLLSHTCCRLLQQDVNYSSICLFSHYLLVFICYILSQQLFADVAFCVVLVKRCWSVNILNVTTVWDSLCSSALHLSPSQMYRSFLWALNHSWPSSGLEHRGGFPRVTLVSASKQQKPTTRLHWVLMTWGQWLWIRRTQRCSWKIPSLYQHLLLVISAAGFEQ